jgi:hypothetical protein
VAISIDPAFQRVGAVLSRDKISWAAAGGWAIDVFLGRVTRPHADIDLAVWRDEQMQLRAALESWDFSIADAGHLRPWTPGELLAPPLHELHARDPEGRAAEFLLNDREDGSWVYRRDATIRLPVARTIRHDGAVPFLAPEVVLLYKSKAPRASDEADFQSALPRLSREARTWLAGALTRSGTAPAWLEKLGVAKPDER